MEEKYTGDMKIHAFKNNTSPDGTSYGSHENYCVSRDVAFPGQFSRDLVPHLATRLIYTGAGHIVRGKYVLSPMAFLTSQVMRGEPIADAGTLNVRDEPHRVARSMVRDSGGRREKGRTRCRHDGVQAVLGNWCRTIIVL